MNHRRKAYDVFLSFPSDSASAAASVQAALADAGSLVFNPTRLPPGRNASHRLREELAASFSIVIVMGDHRQLPPTVALEVGGGLAWNKPMFAIVPDGHSVELPSDIRIVSNLKIDLLARQLRTLSQPLTDQQADTLARVYSEINVPADQLPRSPSALQQVAQRFNKSTNGHWTPSRVLREILVLRKRGRLPRHTRLPASPIDSAA